MAPFRGVERRARNLGGARFISISPIMSGNFGLNTAESRHSQTHEISLRTKIVSIKILIKIKFSHPPRGMIDHV